MSTAPGSRQGRAYRREEIEGLLRGTLAELMADDTSFRDISVDRIVTTAGMARSTFYKYFEDKSSMLQALSAATLKRLYVSQRAWLGKGAEVTRDDVRTGMRELFDAYLEEEAVMRAVAEASVYDPAIRDAYLSGVHDYARATERFIRAGQKAGWVKPCHPGDTAEALCWMTERTTSRHAHGASPRRLDQLSDALANVVCATLFADER